MDIIKAFLTIALTVSVGICQNINIRGTVTDTAGSAIPGAVVMLEKNGYFDTTKANGSFAIVSAIGIHHHPFKPASRKFSAQIKNNLLYISVTEKLTVMITAYTLQGKVSFSTQKTLEPGIHSFIQPQTGAGLYFYKFKTDDREIILKYPSIVSHGMYRFSQRSASRVIGQHTSNSDTITDVIRSTKSGYLNYRMEVTNSDTSGIIIKMISQEAGTITDIDGNTYRAIKIGNQIWTAENFKSTKYNDGTQIQHISDDTTWKYDTVGAYCYFHNDSATNAKKYGALYNWHAVNTGKLAPAGWHVPTDADWDTLRNYLIEGGYNWDGTTTGNKVGKAVASNTDWDSFDTKGCVGNDISSNNQSGFSGLPGSYRRTNGNFSFIGRGGMWWSSTERNALDAYSNDLYYHYAFLYKEKYRKGYGFSIRLVKD